MANIDEYLQKILTATYGEEVRGSIHDAIYAINDENVKAIKYVTPEMFGAVGDGVTDDSIAITEASAVGYIKGDPNKKYRVKTDCYIANSSETINFIIDDNIVVRFTGAGSVHKYDTFEVPLAEVQKHTDRGTFNTRVSSVNDVAFIGCSWLRGTNFLALSSAKNVTISGCTFKRAYQTAASEGGNGYAILITDGCENISIINSKFISIGRHAIYVSKDITDVVSNKYITISNNLFDWSNVDNEEMPTQAIGTDASIQFRYTENALVSNNIFNKVDVAVILIPNVDNLLNNITIDSNIITTSNPSTYAIYSSVSSARDSGNSGDNIVISNNTITSALGVATVNGAIRNNTIISTVRGCVAIYTGNVSEKCIVEGNMLFGKESAITTDSGSDCVMASLLIKNNLIKATDTSGFYRRHDAPTPYNYHVGYGEVIGNSFDVISKTASRPIIASSAKYGGNSIVGGGKINWAFYAASSSLSHAFDDAFTLS